MVRGIGSTSVSDIAEHGHFVVRAAVKSTNCVSSLHVVANVDESGNGTVSGTNGMKIRPGRSIATRFLAS
jgi:hypothetical protein